MSSRLAAIGADAYAPLLRDDQRGKLPLRPVGEKFAMGDHVDTSDLAANAEVSHVLPARIHRLKYEVAFRCVAAWRVLDWLLGKHGP